MNAAVTSGLYRAFGVTAVAAMRLAAMLPVSAKDPQRRTRILERLGHWQGGTPQGDWVWVHAASVGEARIAAALVRALDDALAPDSAPTFVVTCQTPTGHRTASAAGIANVHFFPIDAPGVLRPLLARGRLLLYVSIETELWPLLLTQLAAACVPTAVANARISDGAAPRYRRVRGLFAAALAGLTAVCARDAISAERFVELGARRAAVRVTGDIKFDLATLGEEKRKPLVALDPARPLLVAASTHEGEEDVAVDAFVKLRGERPGLRLALVPRHPERSAQAVTAAARRGLTVAHWSRIAEGQEAAGHDDVDPVQSAGRFGGWDVLVIDRVGVLREALAGAAAAFVGGSLNPAPGGHNLLEAIGEHLRVITGPSLHNVTEQVELLEEAAAITIVRNAEELAAAWREDLANPDAAREAAARARAALASRRGALAATVATLVPLLRAARATAASGPAESRG